MNRITDNQIVHTIWLYLEMKKNYQVFNNPNIHVDDIVKYIQDNWDSTIKN